MKAHQTIVLIASFCGVLLAAAWSLSACAPQDNHTRYAPVNAAVRQIRYHKDPRVSDLCYATFDLMSNREVHIMVVPCEKVANDLEK